MGVRHALFPMLTLGADLAASFPTLFSTASGVNGLVAGPSRTLRLLDYRVRLFSSLRLVFAAPAYEPGRDTFAIESSRLDRLAPGQPLRLTAR